MNMGPESMKPEERDYNFEPPPEGPTNLWVDAPGRVPQLLLDMAAGFRNCIPLGTEAPDFTGQLLGGGEVKLSNYRGKRIVVVVTISISDPPIASNMTTTNPSLDSLYRKYFKQGVEFLGVYVREAIPGPELGPHTSIEEKTKRAQMLKDEHDVKFPIVVDALDGPIHKQYGMQHNAVFVISKAGVCISKSMLLDCTVLDQALDDAVAWDRLDDGETVVKKAFHERIHMCRAPYDPAGRAKECDALMRAGGEGLMNIVRQAFGFDPYTWKKT